MMGAVTGELVLVIVTAIGAVAGIWWRIEGRIEKAKTEALAVVSVAKMEAANTASIVSAQAQLALTQLAEHKVHVAETYVSKTGLREMTAQVLHGQEDLKAAVTHLTERIDRLVDSPQHQARQARPAN
jgi:uncharacterized membrane protein YqgA involved in biofilm formation